MRKSEGDFLSDFQNQPDNVRDREIMGELEREKAGGGRLIIDQAGRDGQGEEAEPE